MFGGDKTCISCLFVKHCEQTDHHQTMQRHLEKVEAIEVLDCTNPFYVGALFYFEILCGELGLILICLDSVYYIRVHFGQGGNLLRKMAGGPIIVSTE